MFVYNTLSAETLSVQIPSCQNSFVSNLEFYFYKLQMKTLSIAFRQKSNHRIYFNCCRVIASPGLIGEINFLFFCESFLRF